MNTSRRTNTRAAGGIAASRHAGAIHGAARATRPALDASPRPNGPGSWTTGCTRKSAPNPSSPPTRPPQTERDVRDHGSPGPRHG